MRRKVLILYYSQYGYHTDSYMYAKYANKNRLDMHVICFDQGLNKIETTDVSVKYLPLFESRIKSYTNFFLKSLSYIRKEKFDLIFHIDSKFTLILRLLNLFQPMVLDIRTGDLSNNNFKLKLVNKTMTISSWFYKRVSVISKGLAEELNIRGPKLTILPLGGEFQDFPSKTFDTIKLLYVGSLDHRHINETVDGFAIFKRANARITITYDIVGFGSSATEQKLLDSIKYNEMESYITFHGRKSHDEVISFFEKCNVGIVYIPQKRYYDFQPSTKLFESLLSGMPVIATNTIENKITLKNDCGVLCNDNPQSFSEAISEIVDNVKTYKSEEIKSNYKIYDWKYIIQNIWEPFILNSIKK